MNKQCTCQDYIESLFFDVGELLQSMQYFFYQDLRNYIQFYLKYCTSKFYVRFVWVFSFPFLFSSLCLIGSLTCAITREHLDVPYVFIPVIPFRKKLSSSLSWASPTCFVRLHATTFFSSNQNTIQTQSTIIDNPNLLFM